MYNLNQKLVHITQRGENINFHIYVYIIEPKKKNLCMCVPQEYSRD